MQVVRSLYVVLHWNRKLQNQGLTLSLYLFVSLFHTHTRARVICYLFFIIFLLLLVLQGFFLESAVVTQQSAASVFVGEYGNDAFTCCLTSFESLGAPVLHSRV